MTLKDLSLRFFVAKDEEYVRLHASSDGATLDLGERGHNFLLLTLARRRLSDNREGLTETSCGWMYVDEVARGRRMSRQQLSLDVMRIRRHFGKRGVIDATDIIERRRSTHQLRLGPDRVSITAI